MTSNTDHIFMSMPSKSMDTWIQNCPFAYEAWENGFNRGVDAGLGLSKEFSLGAHDPKRLAEAGTTGISAEPSFWHPLGYASKAVFVLSFAPIAYTVSKTIYNVASKYFAYQKALAELRATKELLGPHAQDNSNEMTENQQGIDQERKSQSRVDQAVGAEYMAEGNDHPFDYVSLVKSESKVEAMG